MSGNLDRLLWVSCAAAGIVCAAAASPLQKADARERAVTAPQAAARIGKLRYNRDVRPILAENCFACHGPDSAARKAGLRLDQPMPGVGQNGDRAAIVKGNPTASGLIRHITGRASLMPPPSTRKQLTPRQIATLKRWIAEGAEYEAHWSYLPPRRPALPAVKSTKWVRNPIDRFILARMEHAGLQPAPEADRRTLARRLSLDLTGLPPDPTEVDRFLQDRAPDAYEKLVDRLMAMPQWGEHRARYWLDVARYADTHGIHFDNYREIWPYRDWVIQAFNANMPFDRFTIEQLAADLLPDTTLDQRVGTGFVRCNITTNEGGVIPEEYSVLYARDRTETLAQIWLGTTAGCAVCHDHKFDPLSQKEFYSLSAFFNNLNHNVMDGNIKDTPPIVIVPRAEDRPRLEALERDLDLLRKQTDERKKSALPDFEKWVRSGDAKTVTAGVPSEGLSFRMPLNEGAGIAVNATANGSALRLAALGAPAWDKGHVAEHTYVRRSSAPIEVAGAGDFEKSQGFTCAAWVRLPKKGGNGAIMSRMDDRNNFRGWDLWLEGSRLGTHIVSKWPEDAVKVVTREALKPGVWHHVCMSYNGGASRGSIRLYIDGISRETDPQADTLRGSIRTTVPFKIGQRSTTSPIEGTAIQDVRLYSRALSAEEVARLARGTRASYLAALAAGSGKLNPAEKDELFTWWLNEADSNYRGLAGRLVALSEEESTIRQRGGTTHVAQERKEEPMAYVLFRGEYDKRRDPVKPATPASLPPMPAGFPRNRLGLARWLMLPENPLTARVTVNRFWQELFGTGIVKTAGDFGVNGELPSHPELLDWLAVTMRESGWDVKKLFRLMVTSATYRQSALATPQKRKIDPQNRLLSRGPRFRMDAEMLRDYALAVSGMLTRKIGGPSVRPYQPAGVWEAVAMIGSNTRNYKPDTGENLYRRSLYTFWKRAAPPASMDLFNAPSRETCTVRRERTNTPLQALVTLNDIQFVEAARALAERALKEGGPTRDARLDFVAKRILGRPLQSDELPIVRRSLAELERYYRSNPKEGPELIKVGESVAAPSLPPDQLAAWTMLINELLNLDEVLNK